MSSGREEIFMADDLKQQNSDVLQGGGSSDDRISSLHDSLLQHILSFLPIKYVVRSAILSKRWKSLWTGVPRLDFNEHCISYSSDVFLNIVERVVLLRDGSSIQQFRLFLSNCASSQYPRVQSLIAAAVSHELQQLDITFHHAQQFTLPSSIFDCQSLSILKLTVKCALKLPSRISLPNIKVMHLRYISFPNAKSIENLFSCCPFIDELILSRCDLIHWNSVNIFVPSLKRLRMSASFDDNNSCCCITFEAPALRSFNYTGLLTNYFYLTNMSSSSSTIKACIDITGHYGSEEITALRLVKLLQGLEKMVSLRISNVTTELLSAVDATVLDHLPVFCHLKYLKFRKKVEARAFKGLLKFFCFVPNLETIKFSEGVADTICRAGIKWMPNCSLSSLKILSLGNFLGCSHEFFFLTSFLEKVVSLQTINIFLSKFVCLDMQFRDEVEKLSRRFKHCAIILQ